MEAARALADHLIKSMERNSDNLIKDAFRTLTSRYPSEKEHSILIQLLEDQKNLSEKNDRQDRSESRTLSGSL